MCNPGFKFARLGELAAEMGCSYVARATIARVIQTEGGFRLFRPGTGSRTRAISSIAWRKNQLSSILFPVGGHSKQEARELAGEFGDPVVGSRGSQDLCFLGRNQLLAFSGSKRSFEEKKGDFVNQAGEVIGEHRGSWRFTVGQRRHLGQAFGKRMTVIGIDHRHNRVRLGDEDDALMRQLRLTELVMAGALPRGFSCGVPTPVPGPAHRAAVSLDGDEGSARIRFDQTGPDDLTGQSLFFTGMTRNWAGNRQHDGLKARRPVPGRLDRARLFWYNAVEWLTVCL